MIKKDVVIIGAGAAGLMCAAEAGKRGRSVTVIEHCEKAGKKILISGGGRCNFTNKNVSHENFISANPHFCKSALSGFTSNDFISLVEKYGLSYNEKKLGQLFCNNGSKSILDMLLKECTDNRVEIKTGCTVKKVSKSDLFGIETTSGKYVSSSLVIATGGVSIPKMGATGFGYDTAKQFGIKITEIYPGLVPLLLNNEERKIFGQLSGISVDAFVTCHKRSFRENILFTHKGLSGPAILQISSYMKPGDAVNVNLLPEKNFTELIEEKYNSKTELINLLSDYLPKRFLQVFGETYFPSKPLSQFSKKDFKIVSDILHNWEITPSGTEGFDKAEVTCGGIDTDELSSKTMEAKKVKGLYFIGEVVDVTGWLGGYNFQWAWASGFAAGKYI
jgi:predicted Rossmann fold flavoprotein